MTLWRELVAEEPAAHNAGLVNALTNLAVALCDAGDHDEELKLRAEGVARLALLARQYPDEAEDRYHRARGEFAKQCSQPQHAREPIFALYAERDALHELAGGAPEGDEPSMPALFDSLVGRADSGERDGEMNIVDS